MALSQQKTIATTEVWALQSNNGFEVDPRKILKDLAEGVVQGYRIDG